MNENETINKLAWVTCPDCGTTFRVGVPANARDVRAEGGSNMFPVACPKCKHKFRVGYYHKLS
ncbi:MAG: zinc-ribbon domain-containing protein [Candidatus Thermoplasmatota archaeon]|nr:zinc-ribbon domain-containing protein [Candidatus Thermoplasmatota archaeon]MBU4256495.1 zinc-ribbon domain-containing protein [Candidatus Thermoplasmatota archaeon]MCG2826473.1 zinc-ribbon domain-containing protein [Thermoplasmatales archaeon]